MARRGPPLLPRQRYRSGWRHVVGTNANGDHAVDLVHVRVSIAGHPLVVGTHPHWVSLADLVGTPSPEPARASRPMPRLWLRPSREPRPLPRVRHARDRWCSAIVTSTNTPNGR